LWTKPETYCAEKGKPFGWLITLARRRAIDCLRRRQAYTRATDRFEIFHRQPPAQVRTAAPAEQMAFRNDLRVYLQGLMGLLPPAQKTVLEQGFFGGMSQREIARTMRVPLGTIKTRMELGVKKLAHMVGPTRERVA
jgi:RNA polymerase sigma-70 factor (ECF subfamily)